MGLVISPLCVYLIISTLWVYGLPVWMSLNFLGMKAFGSVGGQLGMITNAGRERRLTPYIASTENALGGSVTAVDGVCA